MSSDGRRQVFKLFFLVKIIDFFESRSGCFPFQFSIIIYVWLGCLTGKDRAIQGKISLNNRLPARVSLGTFPVLLWNEAFAYGTLCV